MPIYSLYSLLKARPPLCLPWSSGLFCASSFVLGLKVAVACACSLRIPGSELLFFWIIFSWVFGCFGFGYMWVGLFSWLNHASLLSCPLVSSWPCVASCFHDLVDVLVLVGFCLAEAAC